MTPERAREIAACFVNLDDEVRYAIAVVILAACAEESHAALTEAIARVDEAAAIPQGLSYDQRIAIKGVALRLLALKDKEEA